MTTASGRQVALPQAKTGGGLQTVVKAAVLLTVLGVLVGLIWARLEKPSPGPPGNAAASKGEVPAPAPVPKFLTGPPDQPRFLPSATDYDPSKLGRVMPISEIFDREPRDDAWAAVIETKLPALIVNDTHRVLPGLQISRIECRSTICHLMWGMSGNRESAQSVLMQVSPGSVSGFETDGSYYVALSGGTYGALSRDPEDALKTFKRIRSAALRSARKGLYGNRLKQLNVPSQAWPSE